MATCLYLLIDLHAGQLSWSSAGHLPALLVAPDGKATYLNGGLGPPIATTRHDITRPRAESAVDQGSLLLLYTDGLIERRGECIDQGLERLKTTVTAHRQLPLDQLCDQVVAELITSGTQQDDVVLVVARLAHTNGGDTGKSAHATIAHATPDEGAAISESRALVAP